MKKIVYLCIIGIFLTTLSSCFTHEKQLKKAEEKLRKRKLAMQHIGFNSGLALTAEFQMAIDKLEVELYQLIEEKEKLEERFLKRMTQSIMSEFEIAEYKRITKKLKRTEETIRKEIAKQQRLELENRERIQHEVKEQAKLIAKIKTLKNKIFLENYPTFPDPIPLASMTFPIQDDLLYNMPTLGETQSFFNQILSDCGYNQKSYYQIKSKESESFAGYAIVAQMEQIDKEAYSLPAPERWEVNFKNRKSFSIDNILNAIFGANPGFYRVIVFLISEEPFIQSSKKINSQELSSLAAIGASSLDNSLIIEPFSSDYKCTLLIYEFEIPESGNDPFLRVPSPHSGEIHLDRSGLKKAIKERRFKQN